MIINQKQNIVLEGQRAIDLWLSGKEGWNKWVDSNPSSDISFKGVNFGKIIKQHHLEVCSFSEFVFPAGKISYYEADFGNVKVDFSKARFSDGEISFSNATFEDGEVDFRRVNFGDCDVSFSGTTFGCGDVWFTLSKFGIGASFYETDFGDGRVFFNAVDFGDGSVDFTMAKFGNGYVSFNKSIFCGKKVDFSITDFGNGNVSFINTRFLNEEVVFKGAKFGEGVTDYSKSEFSFASIDLSNISKEQGRFIFSPMSLDGCKKIDFTGSTFNSLLIFTGIDSPVPINLSHVKLSNPIDFYNVNINYRTKSKSLFFRKAVDPSDAAGFRRLKVLAKSSGDNERALEFYAKEMRTSYWYRINGLSLLLFYLYDWVSDYGRSIVRPLLGLLISIIVPSYVYMKYAAKAGSGYWEVIVFSASQSIPIYPLIKEAREIAIDKLFENGLASAPWWLPIITSFQFVFSAVLIVLLGLAFRNKFRT
ncbi:MAG: pentapeptide repeat-containing protein [Candidatus Thiodiazotropha taylori]|nr:pentapeptide repeat-containing protein [Candidatus Thiodiazotropha taylori]